MRHKAFVLRQWRAVRLFAWFSLLIIPLIAWSNISGDIERGEPFDWATVGLALAIAAANLLLAEGIRRWFNFMLGARDCNWRMTK